MKKKNLIYRLFLLMIVLPALLYWGLEHDEPDATVAAGTMEVHFIDVGQGDAILIKTEDACMLVDGGDKSTQDDLIGYLEKQGVQTLELVVGTHPHSDHIGGLAAVINTFQVDKIMMPKAETTTETFRSLLLTIRDRGLKITAPVPGEAFGVGPLHCVAIAPNGNGDAGLNNDSIVLKVTYGDVSFLLTGDAEEISEKEILQKGYDPSAQVLKVGHHGSVTSTGRAFLDAVNPEAAVISCKQDNSYGHPHKEVLERLGAKNVKIFRTDEIGDIVFVTDGKTVYFQD